MKVEWKQCFRIGISIFILFICISYWSKVAGFLTLMLSALSPLVIGFVIAYLLNILMNFYERHWFPKSKKKLCSIVRFYITTSTSEHAVAKVSMTA